MRPLSVGPEPSLSFYAGFYVAAVMWPAGWGQPENPGGINTVRPRFHRGLISDFRFCTRGAVTSCSFVPPRCRTVKFQAVLGAPPPKVTARQLATNDEFIGSRRLIIISLSRRSQRPGSRGISRSPSTSPSLFSFDFSLPPSLCLLWRLLHGPAGGRGQCISQVGGCVAIWTLWSGPSAARVIAHRASYPLPPLRR